MYVRTYLILYAFTYVFSMYLCLLRLGAALVLTVSLSLVFFLLVERPLKTSYTQVLYQLQAHKKTRQSY